MTQELKRAPSGDRARYLPPLVILLTLAVLATIIWTARNQVREKLREQIAARDTKFVYALFLLANEGPGLNENPEDQLFAIAQALALPELANSLAACLYDPQGKLIVAVPPDAAGRLDRRDLAQVRNFRPVSHFYPRAKSSDFFLTAADPVPPKPIPIQEIIIPVRTTGQKSLSGIVQFILDGKSLAEEFARLDKNLTRQAGTAFLGGGSLIAVALGLAFRRVERMNRLLAERTESLLKANQELTLAAKVSAIGSVTAHLIHGLKNPLFGLQHFVSNRGGDSETGSDTEWRTALSTTRRMQSLVNDIVRVLREENGSAQYEISLPELAEMVSAKMLPLARERGVELRTELSAEGVLPNREANLIILILDNLIQNAIQATPSGRAVALAIQAEQSSVCCAVADQGPGLPESVRETLFTPCRSAKEGGSGIGLAISKQLSNHLGAALELKSTGSSGSVFVLSFPKALAHPGAGLRHVGAT